MICAVGLEETPFRFSKKFAKSNLEVYSVDSDLIKLTNLMHNAKLYEVNSRINVVYSDVLEVQERSFDWAYCSPPWGGLNYSTSSKSLPLLEAFPFE